MLLLPPCDLLNRLHAGIIVDQFAVRLTRPHALFNVILLNDSIFHGRDGPKETFAHKQLVIFAPLTRARETSADSSEL
jgi:hypothetical protein